VATNLDHPSSQHTSSSRGDLISSRGDLICNWASARVPIELNGNVLYQTSFACLFIMALFSLKPVAEFLSSSIHRTAFLDWLALRILDPVIIQCLSLLIVSYAALHYFKRCHVAWASNRGAILYPLLVLGLLLIVEIILEYFVFKPTFSFNRPGDSLGDPWFTALIRHYVNLDLNGTEASSTPSGFVLRQTLLALALVFFIHQPNFFSVWETMETPFVAFNQHIRSAAYGVVPIVCWVAQTFRHRYRNRTWRVPILDHGLCDLVFQG